MGKDKDKHHKHTGDAPAELPTTRETRRELAELMDDAPGGWKADPRDLLRVGRDFALVDFDRGGKPGWDGDKGDAEEYMAQRGEVMAEWQERLFAQSKAGAKDALLVVVQGLDTAGKGGIARHVISMVDPQGIHLKAFKAPTEAERKQHFLVRVRRELPAAGLIGLFDRSHYEDVLVPTAAAKLGTDSPWAIPADQLEQRYRDIADMEAETVAAGTRILKFCLLVSYKEQGERLAERLARPDKYWKYSPGDLAVRGQWDAWQATYQEVLRRTSTQVAPWYVIPADHKWYARLVVTEIITRTLKDINPAWPAADFDIEEQKRLLAPTLTKDAIKAHSGVPER